jgi:hydroxymethylpyrimidine pyrophosphatase-like HAD family hydrolase
MKKICLLFDLDGTLVNTDNIYPVPEDSIEKLKI